MQTDERKIKHIDYALSQTKDVNSFDSIRLKHRALPEVNLNQISLTTRLVGKPVNAPIFVSSMTGGPEKSGLINRHLAEACCEVGLAMGVGSQRIVIEEGYSAGLTWSVRNAIGNQPLFANFGAVNLLDLKDFRELGRVIDPIEADGLILHLNPMQEVFQLNGDTNWIGVLKAIARVCDWSPVPIIVKEVGFGLDIESAIQLKNVGVSILDVAGRGGTRFDDIEIAMNQATVNQISDNEVFQDWGYSTIESIQGIKSALPDQPIWASGGIRNGLDIAKSLCLGAEVAGMAGGFLKPALESTESVVAKMQQHILELKMACYGTGVDETKKLGPHLIYNQHQKH